MNLKKMVIFLSASFLPIFSTADECNSLGCVSTIEQLSTTADGLIYVSTPLDETAANCTVSPGDYFVLNPTASNAKEIYSSLLAAYMSNSKIQIRIKEGSSNCEIVYVRLNKNF